MKRIIAVVAVCLFLFAGVAAAADVAAPTLADIYKAVMELKADVAQLKADGFTKANASGQLAVANTTDGQVTIEVTSILAGPDALVVGVKITNNSATSVRMNTLLYTSLTAGGQRVEILETKGVTGEILPKTTVKGVILATALPKDSKDVTFRTVIYNDKTFAKVLEPTMVIPVK
jgi:opacity protein-like surface antigen